MEEHFGARRALLTPSCTSALEIAAVLCELAPGDEVMVACGDLPVTEAVSARLLRLPCHFELEPSDQDRVIGAIHDFFDRR